MLYIPFCYFSALFIFIFRRHRIDASAYITLLFVITSFLSIIMNSNGYYVNPKYITILPTFLYCFLITLLIAPIYRYNTSSIIIIKSRSSLFIKYTSNLFFCCSILLAIFYAPDYIKNFALGEFASQKNLIFEEGLQLTQYPVFIEILLYSARIIFAPFSLFMIFVFFQSIIETNKFNFKALIGSFAAILIGILNIDRSKIFFWIILFGLSSVIYWPFLSQRHRNKIKMIFMVFVSIFSLYIAVVTISRYGESDSGAFGSIINYAGQPFLNFCYFFNEFHNPDGITLKYLFPATHYYIIGDYDSSIALQQEMTERTGIFTGVFYTVLGDFLVSDGLFGPFLIVGVYLVLSGIVLKRNKVVSFEQLLLAFFLMLVPTLGTITYYYNNYVITINLIFIILLLGYLKNNNKEISICKS